MADQGTPPQQPTQKINIIGNVKKHKTAVFFVIFSVALAVAAYFMYKRCKPLMNKNKNKESKKSKSKKESFEQEPNFNEGFNENLEDNSINLNE
jgi:hypothetical protein